MREIKRGYPDAKRVFNRGFEMAMRVALVFSLRVLERKLAGLAYETLML